MDLGENESLWSQEKYGAWLRGGKHECVGMVADSFQLSGKEMLD